MGRIVACAGGIVVLAGVWSSAASAVTLPEAGTCVKVAVGSTGAYGGPSCVTRAPTKPGKYEWKATTASEAVTFAGTGEEPKLASAGHPTISCLTSTISGTYTGGKTATVNVAFQGCTDATGAQCQSTVTVPPDTKSLIESLPLEGVLGFVRNEYPYVSVGLDLKPQPPSTALFTYECGGGPTEVDRIEGSVIAKLKPIDKMTTESNLQFKVREGQQVPTSFVGEPTDTLSTTFTSGLESTTAPTTLLIKHEAGTNSAPLEIKAVEK